MQTCKQSHALHAFAFARAKGGARLMLATKLDSIAVQVPNPSPCALVHAQPKRTTTGLADALPSPAASASLTNGLWPCAHFPISSS
eukprot:scaffold103563_cov21-Tisochrysis_lutea.AAC.3